MKLADRISQRLQGFVNSFPTGIVLPNYYCGNFDFGFYEMDVIRVLPNGFIYEYEIKISRADFKNDFKKGTKHSGMASKKSLCNRFFFVTPKGLVHKNEVPDYAGLIEFEIYPSGEVGYMTVVKPAKLIHKNPVSDKFYKDLATKVSHRENNWRWKLNDALERINNINKLNQNAKP